MTGLAAVACLLLAAAGWHRWSSGSADLAATAIAPALIASCAALLVACGFRGALAEYLPGGINDDNFPAEGLYVLFVINDTAPWLAWWGVIFAAGLCAWLSFARRLLPLWPGASARSPSRSPSWMARSGAVALAGVVGPAWLLVSSAAVTLRGIAAPWNDFGPAPVAEPPA